MNYFNVGKIINTQRFTRRMQVLSVTDFAEERSQKGNKLALFDKKDQFVMDVKLPATARPKNFDIISSGHVINDIEDFVTLV